MESLLCRVALLLVMLTGILSEDTDCIDTLSYQNPLLVSLSPLDPQVLRVTSCTKLAKKYLSLCGTEGQTGGKCCQTCQGQDIGCIDDFRPPVGSGLSSEQFKNCKKFVQADPCRCVDPVGQESCCKSCGSIDTSNLDCSCRDIFNPKILPSFRVNVNVIYTHMRTLTKTYTQTLIENQELQGCSDFRDWYPALCDKFSFCCKSCEGVDSTCIDNLVWRITAQLDDDKCTNCTCHDVAKKSHHLMKHVCRENLVGTNSGWLGARIACCNQCKQLGYEKPIGYFLDHKIDFKLHSIMPEVPDQVQLGEGIID